MGQLGQPGHEPLPAALDEPRYPLPRGAPPEQLSPLRMTIIVRWRLLI